MRAQKICERRIGYARVSTDTQTLYQYTDALNAAGCDVIFTDYAIKATAPNRPGLKEARDALNTGDTFVVLAIDRAFRSTIEGLLFLEGLHKEGIAFHSIYQNIDTRTPEGRKWFIYSVADAEYEQAVISRRTKEKMAAAKRRGQHLGRPFKLDERQAKIAYRIFSNGEVNLNMVAKRYQASPVTLVRAFKRYHLVR
ncbi:MAG: recombinase family protein [Rhodobacteraceae bacterium]|nr:recombinase family protein [Paracoccaceae bacterium]